MTFLRTDPNTNYRALRLLSGRGQWELGLSPYSHGMRLRMGINGRPPQVMDFCLGTDGSIYPKVLMAVLQRLESIPESSAPESIDAIFPWAGTRPLAHHLDELLNVRNLDA